MAFRWLSSRRSSMIGSITILVMCLAAVSEQSVKVQCPAEYKRSSVNSKCYKVLSGVDVNEATAKTNCNDAAGGFLPVITSLSDNSALHSVWKAISLDDRIPSDPPPWIGLTCSTSVAADCKWELAGENSDYRNFEAGQPNVGSNTNVRNCVAFDTVNTDKWASSSCASIRLAICEAKGVEACDSPYTLQNGKCWNLSTNKSTFSVAESECNRISGSLISLHSQIEADELLSLVQSKHPEEVAVWLGASLDPQLNSNQFQWKDNSPWDFSNFTSPFPSMRYGDCLKLVSKGDESGYWHNVACITQLPFVCAPWDVVTSPSGSCPQSKYFADVGEIQSPGYPYFYGTVDCDYHINVDLSKFVQVTFNEDFSLRQGDTLNLFDGEEDDQPFQRLQGLAGVNKTYTTSKSNLLRLRLTSKKDSTAGTEGVKGWMLTYAPVGNRQSQRGTGGETTDNTDNTNSNNNEAVEWPDTGDFVKTAANVCPPSNYSVTAAKLSSPGFGSSAYGNMLNCTYTIQLEQGQRVELRFQNFNTEGCCDFVDVFDGPDINAKTLTTWSGTAAIGNQSVISSGSSLTLRFTSDSLINAPGWLAEYRPLPKANK